MCDLELVSKQIGNVQLVGRTSEEPWGYCGMLPVLALLLASVSINISFLPAPGWPLLHTCQ